MLLNRKFLKRVFPDRLFGAPHFCQSNIGIELNSITRKAIKLAPNWSAMAGIAERRSKIAVVRMSFCIMFRRLIDYVALSLWP
jgi:hypothetical protein